MADEDNAQRNANDKVVVKTWRAWKTVHEMVNDRGYELGEDEVRMSLDAFRNKYTNLGDNSVNRSMLKFSAKPSDELIKKYTPPKTDQNPDPEPDCGTIWVEFLDSENLGTSQMRDFGKYCSHNNFKNGLLISNVAVSSAAKKEISKWSQWTNIEWFLEEDLLINITHHELVPRHIILSREEKVALLKRYRLKETQLPRILVKDPVAKYFGMKRGQVVKIIRRSETAGRYASYRLCV